MKYFFLKDYLTKLWHWCFSGAEAWPEGNPTDQTTGKWCRCEHSQPQSSECAAVIYHLIRYFSLRRHQLDFNFFPPLQAVLTRLCGCDKLLQSLSVELAQLQMDKVSDWTVSLALSPQIFTVMSHICPVLVNVVLLQDSVHCALEVSRLQLEEWQSQGPRAQEEALTQKALLQEELVTIRARMCDVSLVCKNSMVLHAQNICDCKYCNSVTEIRTHSVSVHNQLFFCL